MNDRKISSIQSMRGIAACYVALFHMSHITFYPTVSPPSVIEWLVKAGLSGVSLFFIISAFTMCLSTEARDEKALLPFFVRRFFRIAPLFYVWIALSCARDYLIMDKTHTASEVLLNVIFLFNFKQEFYEAIPWAGWTIGVEMVFYACFPFIFRFTRTIQNSAIALAICVAIGLQWLSHFIAQHGDPQYATMGFASRLPIFMLGIFLYRLQQASDVLQQTTRKYLSIIAIIAGLILMGFASKTRSGILLFPLDYTQALAWALIMYGLLMRPLKVTNFKPLLFVGEISYSIYLSHATVLHLLSMAGLYTMIASVTGDSGFAFYFSSFAIGMIAVVAVSYATYVLIESPGIRLGSALLKSRRVRQLA